MATINNAKKVLLILPNRIGDAIFCTSPVEQLAHNYPTLQLDVVALTKVSAQVFAHNPVITRHFFSEQTPLTQIFDDYDAVVSLRNSQKVQQYVGQHPVTYPSAKLFARPVISQAQYLAKTFGHVYKPPGPYRMFPQVQHRNQIKQLLSQRGINLATTPLIGWHMGNSLVVKYADHPLKRWVHTHLTKVIRQKTWPPHYFLALMQCLHQTYPHAVFVLTGSMAESRLAAPFKHKDYVVNLIGETSVLELAALMELLQVYLVGDTGPLHVACAMNVPLVSLFSLTDPDMYGPHPQNDHSRVLYQKKMTDIQVDTVLQHMLSLISDQSTLQPDRVAQA